MEPHDLTAALLFLTVQRKEGKLTADEHGTLKTQLLSGDQVVQSTLKDISTGIGTIDALLQRMRIDASVATASSPSEPELLRAPLEFLGRSFREASRGRRADELSEDWGAARHLLTALEALGGWNAVPLLSSLRDDQVTPGRLVRFRGMVQDMFDPEFYISVYERSLPTGGTELLSGMFSDTLAGEEVNPATHKYGERQLLYCIPVPAESLWATAQRAPARRPEPSAVPSAPATKQSTAAKRTMTDEGDTMQTAEPNEIEDAAERQKRNKSESERDAQRRPDPSLVQASFPLPSYGPIYEPGADYKLNEVIEFIGVLSINPEMVSFDQDADDFLDPSSALPPSLVPRIHAIVVRRDNASVAPVTVLREHMPISEVRRRAVELLGGFLRGDSLTAEYLLLNILSKVHSRQAAVPVGRFTLNITGAQPPLVRPLEALMKQLLPRCSYFPLTVSNMQSCHITPRKDHKSNKLLSGVLQLTEGTHIIVDETQLTTGDLGQTGSRNLRTLRHAIEQQRVPYDFAFHQLEFDINFPVLILSRSKAILPADCLLPLRPAEGEAVPTVPTEGLEDVRLYLQAARNCDFSIEPEVSAALEQRFVAMRQQQPETGPELLHYWLTLGRLLAASYGEPVLSMGLWQRMLELEEERKRRFS